MEGKVFITLAELHGIRRQLRFSKVVLEKLNSSQLKKHLTASIFENETIVDVADSIIRNDVGEKKEDEHMELESTIVVSDPEKSLTRDLKSGSCSNVIDSNINSVVFKDREKRSLILESADASTDQENMSDLLYHSKREVKSGNSPKPLKSANILNPIDSHIKYSKETVVGNQMTRLENDMLISNPRTLSGNHKQDFTSGFDGRDFDSTVKSRKASYSITRKIHSDNAKLKKKKKVTLESFCFLDIEDSSDHHKKTTKDEIKGLALDSTSKCVPNSVESSTRSDKKQRKEKKQHRLGSTKYSCDIESSSKHRGWESESVVKYPIFNYESGGSLNKIDNKARSEKCKGIKIKRIENTQSSLDKEISSEFGERGGLVGSLKDPVFSCESGGVLNKRNKTSCEGNKRKRVRRDSRNDSSVPESRMDSLKGESGSNVTNLVSKCQIGSASKSVESKKNNFNIKNWAVVNVKSRYGKEVLKIIPSTTKEPADNKSSCGTNEIHKCSLSPMPSLSCNFNQDLQVKETSPDIAARSNLTSHCNIFSSAEKSCVDVVLTGDVPSPDSSSLRNLSAERSESKGEKSAAFSKLGTSENVDSVSLSDETNSLAREMNLLPDEVLRRDLYSPISQASSPQPSSTSLADITLLEKLFLKRSDILKVIARLKEERLKIEETREAAFESLERARQSKERVGKEMNDVLIVKQSNKLLKEEFKEVKQKVEVIQTEMESLTDVDFIKKESYFNRLQELQVLYARLEEIKREIESYRTSVISSVSVQEVLIAEEMRVQNLQKEFGCLEVQKDEIKLRQENMEKQLEENKMEVDKELLRQREFCSALAEDISVVRTTEVTSLYKPEIVESLFSKEMVPSPDSQTTFIEHCIPTLSSSSSQSTVETQNHVCQVPINSGQKTVEKELQKLNKTYSTLPAESLENQPFCNSDSSTNVSCLMPQPSPDSRMSPSNVMPELNNLCLSVKNEVISRTCLNPSASEDPMDSKTGQQLKKVKNEFLFPRETKLAFKRLVSLVLRATPEKPENIVLQKDLVVSLVNIDAWPELYSQIQQTNFLLQPIPYSVFIEDLEKIQASNITFSGKDPSVSPEVLIEENDHLALQHPELVCSTSAPSLLQKALSNHLSYSFSSISGPNLSEIQDEYSRDNHQTQPRQGFNQTNYPNDNHLLHNNHSVGEHWQQNMYPGQLLNNPTCLPMRSHAQAEDPNSDHRNNQMTPHFPTRSTTQVSDQASGLFDDIRAQNHRTEGVNQKMTTFSKPGNYNFFEMQQDYQMRLTTHNWQRDAFSTNLRQQYSLAMPRPFFPVSEPFMRNRQTAGPLQGFTNPLCVVCGRRAVHICSHCRLRDHLYCSEACQHHHWGVHQHYCR